MDFPEQLFAVSVRGASHIKAGTPMQDYSLSAVTERYSIAIVCDGHGAAKHFRSEFGSKFAAEATQEKLVAFADANPTWERAREGLDEKLSRLRLAILAEWEHKIEGYTLMNPFTEEERKKASPSFAAREKYSLTQPYGTTLLAALVMGDYSLLLMVGDGAIVRFMPDGKGEVVTFPSKKVYDDQPHSATDSLCQPNAYDVIFTHAVPREKGDGSLYALCSDGISEAFVNDDYLIRLLKSYIDHRMQVGREQAEAEIAENLFKLSQKTTEDDMSLAFAAMEAYRYDVREDGEQ